MAGDWHLPDCRGLRHNIINLVMQCTDNKATRFLLEPLMLLNLHVRRLEPKNPWKCCFWPLAKHQVVPQTLVTDDWTQIHAS